MAFNPESPSRLGTTIFRLLTITLPSTGTTSAPAYLARNRLLRASIYSSGQLFIDVKSTVELYILGIWGYGGFENEAIRYYQLAVLQDRHPALCS